MTGTLARGSYRERNATADRALDILLLFSDERPALSGAQVALHLGVARSTAYRYLQSLLAAGLVEGGPAGYRIGPRVLGLARLARKAIGLEGAARPVMRRLSDELCETVLLTRRSGSMVVCLDRVEHDPPVRLSYERGHILPVNAGAPALALLAWSGQEEIRSVLGHRPLTKLTRRTLTDPDQLVARLRRIRVRGVAVTREELDKDVVGVAAPVFGTDGEVRAAVSVAVPVSRLTADRLTEVERRVRRAAAEIAGRLTDTAPG
ncbi:IclR family transcriptional regulator [Streptomyces sp. BE230]|uniref:IclR family transcriptional regulator n=1 Tax=Streptomyces sp. BE230 TaxID=3002526 RepID=UPI002ED55056|nr:IclR family transcriptional regulator [Streptomyces sp. BE230]